MGRKLRAEQKGVFPYTSSERFRERNGIVNRELARRAGLPDPEEGVTTFENLGNRELPVWNKKKEIQKTLRDNQVSMVEGATGSGKSTQVGQYALEMGYEKIIYLEPRIALADNLSDRLIEELSGQLGHDEGENLVGVRHSERSNGRGKRIEVMTPDTFIRVFDELDALADAPVLVIGDEIHEKDFPTELGVAVTAMALSGRPKWRLCVMSATLDADPIREAYGGKFGKEVPLVSVEGRPFDLEIIEEPDLTIDEAYAKYRADHRKAQLFTAGKEEIKEVTKEVSSHRYLATRITPFHAKLSRAKRLQATHATLADWEKQVIPSTNAGSSGITIPGQTLVISDGTVRRQDLDEDAVQGLFREYCAQDELVQQAGRAGRDVGGGQFILVKPNDDNNFGFIPMHQRKARAPAQIYHTNISSNVLTVASLGRDFYDANQWLIHGVSDRVIIEAYDTLYRLGAIDEQNNLTEVGELMERLPLRPEFARAVVAAVQSGAASDRLQQLVATMSAINAGGLPYFERGVGEAWRDDIRAEVTDDYMAQLDMFIATRELYDGHDVDERELERRNYDLQQTKKAHTTYDKVCRALGIANIDDITAPSREQMEELKVYLTAGLFDFAHVYDGPANSSGIPSYISIYDDNGEKSRTLTDRGTYKGGDTLVLGMPRRFEKRVKGVLEEFSVIENVMPTTVESLASAALWLAQHVPGDMRIKEGRLEQHNDLMLGSIKLGSEVANTRVAHTEQTRELLKEAAFNKPTQALNELVQIKKELEWLVRRVPRMELGYYFPQGVITDEWLRERIDEAIDSETDSIFSLDNNLRRWMVVKDIARAKWISDATIDEIMQRSPEVVNLTNGQSYQLYYTHGRPIINGFNLRDAEALPNALMLPDGREVFIHYRIGHDTKAHTASEIKEYSSTL